MQSSDAVLAISRRPRQPHCAYCEQHRIVTTKKKKDTLLRFCRSCVPGQDTYVHLSCVPLLRTSEHGHLHCVTPECRSMFAERYDNVTLDLSKLARFRRFYNAMPILWGFAGFCCAVLTLLYSGCTFRPSGNGCFYASWTLDFVGAALFAVSFFGNFDHAPFYLRFNGSKDAALQRLTIEITVLIVGMLFGLGPLLLVSYMFEDTLWFACWVFFFHMLVLPVMLWKLLRGKQQLRADIADMDVSLDSISVLDLSQTREAFREALPWREATN